jgi:hypothetical protein
MARRPNLAEDIKSGNLETPEKRKPEPKKAPSLETFLAKLSPAAREQLYDLLVDRYVYNDFRDEEDEDDEQEESEDEE